MAEFPSEIKGYTPICLCGRGAFGEVWLVIDTVQCYRALKIVSKSMIGGDWNREFDGLKNYQTRIKYHPNLIQIHHIRECNSFFYYTMDCADNMGEEDQYVPSTLEHWIQKFGPLGYDTLSNVFEGILNGTEYLHSQGLIHRDIKPDNIIFVDSIPKLSDIGLVSSMSKTMSLAGTQAYIPPEYLTGAEKKPNHEMDIYALGKTLYRAFSGQQADDFPIVPPSILKDPKSRIINQTTKAACHNSPLARIKKITDFRSALAGSIGYGFVMRSFLAFFFKLLTSPYNFLCWCIENTFWRNVVFLALLNCMILVGYDFYVSFKNTKMAQYGILSAEEEKEYMLLREKKLTPEDQQRLNTLNEKIKRQIEVLTPPKSYPADQLNVTREHKMLYQETFKSLDNWQFYTKSDFVLLPNGFYFGNSGNNDIVLQKLTMPPEYEIRLNFALEGAESEFELLIFSIKSFYSNETKYAKYNEVYRHPSYILSIGKNGTIGKLRCRNVAGQGYSFPVQQEPYIKQISGQKHQLSVVKINQTIRFYIDGQILYIPVEFDWPDEKIRIRTFSWPPGNSVTIEKLEIYSIAPKSWGTNDFIEPSSQ